jgi:hypothetical protein
MSKKIKQDYEEQKKQAAENNSINQIETFHAESMTMEAHKSKDENLFGLSNTCCFSFSYT